MFPVPKRTIISGCADPYPQPRLSYHLYILGGLPVLRTGSVLLTVPRIFQKGYFDPLSDTHRSPRGGGDQKDIYLVIGGRLPTHISNLVELLRTKKIGTPLLPHPLGHPWGRGVPKYKLRLPGRSVGRPVKFSERAPHGFREFPKRVL